MRSLSKLFAISILTLLAACGSSDSPPGPLSKHFDDMHIARIPIEQQRAAIETIQSEYQVAKMQQANSAAELQEAQSQLAVVKNDAKATKLAIDSAISNKKSAEASADNNRINQAAKELHAAESAKKAAEARVKYYEAYTRWLKLQNRYDQEGMYWHEAKFELAKAQLAQKNGVSPKGVQYDWFPKQETERKNRTAKAKDKANAEKQKALAARSAWLAQQSAADKENGRTSSLPDPMAPKAAPEAPVTTPTGTTGTTGTGTTGTATPTPEPAPAPAPTE